MTPFHSPPLTLLATSTTAGSPVWLTEFQPTAGLTHIDAVVTPTDAQGNARVQLVAQFATTDPASPSAPVAVGSATATQAKVTADVSSAASSNGFFRLGLRPVLSTGSTAASISARVQGWQRRCGGVIGREEVPVGPMPANTPWVVAVTGPFPARQFSTVAAVMKTLGKESATSGSVKTRRMSRVFEKDLSEPGAWAPLEAYDTVSAVNAERFVSAVSPGLTPNTNTWGQLGVAVETTTNDVSVTVMVLTMGAS